MGRARVGRDIDSSSRKCKMRAILEKGRVGTREESGQAKGTRSLERVRSVRACHVVCVRRFFGAEQDGGGGKGAYEWEGDGEV